MIFSTCDIIT